ncbi:uncharacterized protein EV154DRAFT_313463 [Mucor mucedo]|uniref:Uncharacterized protein n=1 Tax=Mucor saturninus TaxID=64648 RepID=A0A8H7R670_9FUNG|nr:uncharacterized protein EV154DRAFT_313463 [Mucor mucedo]KAG2204567.1 hypothetical protein INT47_012626 [Mucor saturninus]KAI7888299.1 hypothetical protein EV154DRAFT_313463 [Mucor mucedo]
MSNNFDLLNVSGNKKKLEDLINPSAAPDQKSINDIPAMLAAASVDRKTFAVGPPSDILSRVQAFLPQLKSANEQLKAADPKSLDIENVEEDDGQYIEMNLGLGVYEEKRPGQSDSEDEDSDDNDDEKLVLPNSVDKSNKPFIEEVKK